ncbi:MAG: MFS transporter [Bordetella sp.]|nr:MFS transporter [Bordetella sp.]
MDNLNSSARTLDVQSFMDGRKLSSLQWLVLLLCFLVVAADGFDTVLIGFAAASITKEWGLPSGSLGPVMSAALAGLGIGALVAGPMADRVGRKLVITLSVLWFGAWSLISAYATSIDALTTMRFLTGLGLGSALPNALTLMSEYSPTKYRARMVNAAFCGYPCGVILGALSSSHLIPIYGWHSIFIAGGVLPLVLVLPLFAFLPESVKLMVARGQPAEKVRRLMSRMAPTEQFKGTTFSVGDGVSTGRRALAFLDLLSPRFAVGTILLWLVYFMGLVVFYFLTSWLPLLLKDAGFDARDAALVTSLFPLGGIFGIMSAGWIVDRFPPIQSTALMFGAAALLAIFVYNGFHVPVLLCILVFLSGMTVSAATAAMSPLAANFYPTAIRATGIAWMFGVGRIGGVAGAYIGATLKGMGFGFDAIFGMLAVPAALAALGLFVMAWVAAKEQASASA